MTDLPFDLQAVRALAAILADTGLSEIEVEGKDGRIRVARAVMAHAPVAATVMQQASPAPVAPSPAMAVEVDDAAHPGAVLSPMVGVAYLAPEPGAAQFINIGQTVSVGQTLLLIEAMKTFNQIKAPKAGTLTRILISSGSPVEYGEPLMILE